ncbi:predicted protein [Sclerotinia sclerotiorum 1980 UF-70]|uniref:Uncharacterized protein n=1 Tax=Sclerotinia sclerotiorum (strain ATCC 18683 / 1980 / Ss-1) TaxID=665079 RepID=A7EJS1_SCLS1|nr:predicted protein [Sclerotinia sclerotiorum 1980 UF-70]EDO03087.1 predicted protein [Sclerotinia sclerotiorum 1980 UF-70]
MVKGEGTIIESVSSKEKTEEGRRKKIKIFPISKNCSVWPLPSFRIGYQLWNMEGPSLKKEAARFSENALSHL